MPRLLTTLRDGLDTTAMPTTKTSEFFEALMAIHQRAFKPTDDASVVSEPAPLSERAHVVEEGNPWIAPEEAQSSNFMEMPEAAVSPAPPEPADGLLTSVPVDGELPLGAWVELMSNDQWASHPTHLGQSPRHVVFIHQAHGTTQSMTRRSRDRLIEQGRLRMVSGRR